MTIKNIALALLAVPAMADQHCALDATQPHFSVELAGGGCTMNGHVQSQTPNPDIPPRSSLSFEDFQVLAANNLTDPTVIGEVVSTTDFVMGYRANWNTMNSLPSQMGFAGQINMHYNYMCNGLGAGLYAGVGHNASRSSSNIPASFDPTIQSYLSVQSLTDKNTTVKITGDNTFTMDNNEGNFPLLSRAQKTKNIPRGKATVSSGLMFQAGTRLGAMIGNVFPHVRLGWACYQFKAQMTNQHSPWTNSVQAQIRSDNFDVHMYSGPRSFVVANEEMNTPFRTIVGVGQYMDAFDAAYNTNKPIKITSKCQWTNAVTIGAGVDWAFHRMTLGFFYQVGICQKLTFKKWNKDVTAGLTSIKADYVGPTENPPAPKIIAATAGKFQATGGTMKMQYGKSTPPEVSIAPVMHTAMVSVKYVLGKAA